jgi:hypothetical protein
MNTLPTFSALELDAESAVLLRERETMATWLNFVVINAVNYAAAINLGSLGSSATAVAVQTITVTQS